ncbi:MAG: 5'-nucleotidase C-terminal domain-containing protein, partial [Clostridium perfringens]|nr:5'-nucleotidase C-terminal domain-containing protein [Clostridium perfringens]
SNSIFVGGGDLYQGTAISNLLYGEPVSKIIEEMGMKYSAVGNHEFDWGLDKIDKWSKYVEFLAANIYDKTTGKPVTWAKPYAIEEIDGVKIGFIGIATPETAYKTSMENVKDLEFKDPVEITNAWAKYLKNEENVDFVIALTHLGGEQDENGVITGEVSDLANGSTLLDGIISGHTHNYIAGTVNNVAIVQAANNGRALGNLQITIDEDGTSKVTASLDELYKRVDTLPVDETVQKIVSEYEDELNPILSEVVFTVDTELSHDRDYNGVTKLGQFMTKYMAEISDVQIALTNSGGLRTSLDKGGVTVGDMWDVLPFDNTLVTMKLKGSDLKRVIEHGIMNNNVGWIQYYGLNVYYDSSKEYGNRITSMRLLDGTKIEMDKYYSVVTNDFMYANGDNYDFTGAIDVVDTQTPIRDALMVRFKELGNISFKFNESTIVDGQDSVNSEDGVNDNNSEAKPEEGENSNDSSNGTNGSTGEDESNKDENTSQGKDEESSTVGGSTSEENTQNKPNSGLGNLPHTGVPALAGIVALIGVGFIVAGKKMNKDDENKTS